MSKAKICDRCGKVCKSVSGMIKIEMRPYITFEAVLDAKCKSFDLCEQCIDELDVWISEIFLREAADDK